jgi:hypothetical protein
MHCGKCVKLRKIEIKEGRYMTTNVQRAELEKQLPQRIRSHEDRLKIQLVNLTKKIDDVTLSKEERMMLEQTKLIILQLTKKAFVREDFRKFISHSETRFQSTEAIQDVNWIDELVDIVDHLNQIK